MIILKLTGFFETEVHFKMIILKPEWCPDNCLQENCPMDDCPPGNCPQEKLPCRKLHTHHKTSLENNCCHSSKLTSTSTTSELRKTMQSMSTIIYEYCNVKSKNRFTSIYFLHISTKPCTTQLIIEHLLLNNSLNWKKYKKTS